MKLEEMKITELFDTSHTIAAKLFEGKTYPWEVLENIGSFIEELGATLPEKEYRKVERTSGFTAPPVWPPPLPWEVLPLSAPMRMFAMEHLSADV